MRRKTRIGILSGVLVSSLSLAQTTPQPAAAALAKGQSQAQPAQAQPAQPQPARPGQPSGLRIAPGSVIPVQLTKTVDAKKVKIGDEVDAKVTQDLKTNSGEVVVPKDTKVVGHVTEAQAWTKDQKESQVAIAFNQAVLKDGQVASLPMSIQAVIAQQNQAQQNQAQQNQSAADSDPGAGMSPSTSSGSPGARSGGMGGSAQQSPGYPTGGSDANSAPTPSSKNPPITSSTQGVIGISNYALSPAGDVKQGSVVSSEKNNVKLESGTLMLLKVSQ